jgi:long-chain fatty acid transport protein
MMKTKIIKPLVTMMFLGLAVQAHAGGLYLYEMGTEDVGLANAGSAARAQDASVVANNPAGMTRLQGSEFTFGAQALYGDVDYDLNDSSLNNAGNVVGWQPGGSAFYSHSINDDLKVGVALYGTFGLSLIFNNNWAGRNLVTETTLTGLTLQPTVAYRLNNKWSIGAGVGINYGIFKLKRKELEINGGNTNNDDDTDVAANVKLGIFFEPSEHTRLGLTYTSKVDYDFHIDTQGTLPGPEQRPYSLPFNLKTNAPQQAMFSGVHVLNDKWSLLGEVGWQDWSSFSQSKVTVNNFTESSGLDLHDTWHGAVGTQYQLTEATRLNFGIAYDSSMYKDQDETSIAIPSGASWRFGTGVQHQLSEHSSLGAAFEYVYSETSKVSDPEELSGEYNNPQVYFLSANYSYRF